MKNLSGALLILLVTLLAACNGNTGEHPYRNISYKSLKQWHDDGYVVSNTRIRHFIDSLQTTVSTLCDADRLTDDYYAQRKPYLWIDRSGTDLRGDTMMKWADDVVRTGLPEKKFYLPQIRENLRRLRALDFDDKHTANRTFAMLEYYLTRGYLRYVSGQRFGFVSPRQFLNHLSPTEGDTTGKRFDTLFDMPAEYCNADYFHRAARSIRHGLTPFIANTQPDNPLYARYSEALAQQPSAEHRKTLEANLERARWHTPLPPERGRRVVVNLPSQELAAYDDSDHVTVMKICCGSTSHKTPLLSGRLSHIELNPYWNIPQSIIKKEVANHAGNADYFYRHRYEIVDRKSGSVVYPGSLTSDALSSGNYSVRQQRGEGNALGRMIFRFPNSHAIYLHDTNNRGAFDRNWRCVSHGCIRVERPMELATLLLPGKDSIYLDRLRYTVGRQPLSHQGKTLLAEERLATLNSCKLSPHVPVNIIYHTCYPTPGDTALTYYPDIYGYDQPLVEQLHKF